MEPRTSATPATHQTSVLWRKARQLQRSSVSKTPSCFLTVPPVLGVKFLRKASLPRYTQVGFQVPDTQQSLRHQPLFTNPDTLAMPTWKLVAKPVIPHSTQKDSAIYTQDHNRPASNLSVDKPKCFDFLLIH